jgi:hypothetical protein
MFRQFKFEEHLYPKLEQIPLSTQYKLEGIGFNFPSDAWDRLPLEERWVLCHLGTRSKGERECYNHYLAYVLRRQKISPSSSEKPGPNSGKKAWEDLSRLPAEVAQKMRDLNLPLFWPEWIKLDDIERYALFKLCLEKSTDAQIQQVVQEFLGLSSPSSVPAS